MYTPVKRNRRIRNGPPVLPRKANPVRSYNLGGIRRRLNFHQNSEQNKDRMNMEEEKGTSSVSVSAKEELHDKTSDSNIGDQKKNSFRIKLQAAGGFDSPSCTSRTLVDSNTPAKLRSNILSKKPSQFSTPQPQPIGDTFMSDFSLGTMSKDLYPTSNPANKKRKRMSTQRCLIFT